MPKLFVSDAIAHERLMIASPESGTVSSRWKKLSALYKASFAVFGYRITPIIRPEIYQAEVALKTLGVDAADWHLAVKPIEHLRPFHGLTNAFVCDWPYAELAKGPNGDSPFYDQVRLLDLADIALCCTEFTTQTLRRAGIEQAITLPPIIAPPAKGVPARPGRGAFLCVTDQPFHAWQYGHLIEGFRLATNHERGLRLTICIQGSNAQTLSEFKQYISQSVAASGLGLDATVSAVSSEESQAAVLYDSADFLLCVDVTVGLCLPIIKAMLEGLPLVTTMTGGTASFLSSDAAVLIATEPRSVGVDETPFAQFLNLTADTPTAETICDAILAAVALNDDARAHMADISRAIAETRFSQTAFKTGLRQISDVIALDGL